VPSSDLLSAAAGTTVEAQANENLVLAFALELGIVGAVFCLILLVVTCRILAARWKNRDLATQIGVVLVVQLLVGGLAGPMLMAQPGNLIFWLAVASLTGGRAKSRNNG
jgi:O-antigen ligase